MSDWQDIATAPEGVPVLVFSIGDISIGVLRVSGRRAAWFAMADGSSAIRSESDFGIEYLELIPSHWCHLPAPPVIK